MMCEHEWITTRAVYRTSDADGYKNHEINRRVCINCLKTRDEIELEQQLAAANARIAELEQQNKRMRDALGKYAAGYVDCGEEAKAALEGK